MLHVYEKDTNVFESNRPGLCQSHCKDIHQKNTRWRKNFKPIPKELTKELYFSVISRTFMVNYPPQDQMTITFLRFFKIFYDFL